MFWRFGGYSNISSIDTVLDKPDVTLEDLLDESDLIQELKQQNSKLIEFLREESVLTQLFHHVTADKPLPDEHLEDPEDAAGEDKAKERAAKQAKGKEVDKHDKSEKGSAKISFFGRPRSRSKSVSKRSSEESDVEKKDAQRKKYAYVACEVLSAEVWSITEAMLEYQQHLRDFWEYLRRPAPLDPVQAGYFTKVNDTLLDKKTEDMFAMLKSLDGIIPEMLKHVDCPMIMDLLLKMISLEKHEGGQGIVDWLQSQGLIPILLSYLGPDNSSATQTAAGDFLKAIITISANATGQDQTVIGPNELTRQLVSEKCVAKLIDDMLHGGNPLTVGVGIVIEVIRKNNSDYDLDTQVGPEPRTTDPIYLGVLLREFSRKIPAFMNLIRSSSATRPELKAAFGERIQPLGFDRFKTCELMAELLHCSNMGLLNERGSDAEMTARDVEREALKAEGKLTPAPLAGSEADEGFASSVDSHGFHHARAPDDEFGESPEKINRLEIQNVADEDGFEKVGVPEAEALPDEVTFDDFNEKIEEDALPPAPLKLSRSPERSRTDTSHVKTADIEGDESEDSQKQDRRRVSLLTQQIQDQIDETGSSQSPTEAEPRTTEATHPEDKPAPLFARSTSPSKGVDPILGAESPNEEADPGSQSTATLQPENSELAANRDQQQYEADVNGSPVAGDYLKMQFVEHQVVPTILDFFFRFPWNNFLHNVVYDVVQQVFNGTLERGYNRTLAQNLFEASPCGALFSTEEITRRILDGQAASDKSQRERGMRLGYMGHLTLIAEEVCKFAERHPPELLGELVMERVMTSEWVAYVEGTLTETRDKDNAVLGGVRPEQNMGIRSLTGGGMLSGQGGFGGGGGNSSALANAGLGTPADSLAMHDTGAGGFDADAGGFGEGEDEEMEDVNDRNAVDDDEQTSSPSSSSSSGGLPPPLNIPPSRARLQLAARLEARKRAAAAAAGGGASGATEPPDPDSADPLSLDTTASPEDAEPFTLNNRRSTFDDDDDTSSAEDLSTSSSDDDETTDEEAHAGREVVEYHEDDSDSDEEEELLVAPRRGPPPPLPQPQHQHQATTSSSSSSGGTKSEESSSSSSRSEERRRRTTEAKVRMEIESDEDR